MAMKLRNRAYSVNNESDWVREYAVTYAGGGWFRVELTDSYGTFGEQATWRGYRSERDAEQCAASLMEEAADKARATCECGLDADAGDNGNGNWECGSLAPHGIHTHVSEDGCDVTQDYLING